MKPLLLALCGCLFATAACRAQGSADTPILLVYVTDWGSMAPAAPRIALGLEQPTLRICAVEKSAWMANADPNLQGVALQLKSADAGTLATVLKEKEEKESPGTTSPFATSTDTTGTRRKILWLVTPENKILGTVDSLAVMDNVARLGVMGFTARDNGAVVTYLQDKLHLP